MPTKHAPQEGLHEGGLMITQEGVVAIIGRFIDTDGLEAAKEYFKVLNQLFCTEPGWAATAQAVYSLFAEEQKRLRAEQFSEALAKQRAGAPSIIMMNQNEATGMMDSKPFTSFTNNFYDDVENVYNNKE